MALPGPPGPTQSKWPKGTVRSYHNITDAVACEGGGGGTGPGGPFRIPLLMTGANQREQTAEEEEEEEEKRPTNILP